MLVRRAVLTELHHAGELQLRAVRRHQAQGEDEPPEVLLRGLTGALAIALGVAPSEVGWQGVTFFAVFYGN